MYQYNQLWNQIGFYSNLHRVKRDVQQLMSQVTSLRPSVGDFSNQGRSIKLFYLYGTIPIYYNGAQYNIPVTIYLDPPYPNSGPRCFVSPTANMAIKPRHKHVDSKGMIYLPYLASWNPSQSTLTELMTIISSTFSTDPPVYSKPASAQTSASSSSSSSTEHRPSAAAAAGGSASQPPDGRIGGIVNSLFNKASGFVMSNLGMAAQGGQPAGSGGSPSQQPSSSTASPGRPSVLPSSGASAAQPSQPARSREDILREDVEKQVKERWPRVVQPIISRLDEQLDMQDQRESFGRRIGVHLAQLQEESASIDRDMEALDATHQAVNTFMEAEKHRKFVADEIVEPSNALSKQIMELSADVASQEDMLDKLDEALKDRIINLADFLQSVRETSREAFMIRQLKAKVVRLQRQRSVPGASLSAGMAAF
ncbi:unnamed protein product [Vitrella brassicaformis CCMP3155]|uniref:UEV domain-containing protein n=2 Tax=Vitrella brassicaformis TaxID=1169539 RepID=A0A0G4GA20_VITBC|nr:unnamed protein product [Vitrella brassicaformis CCMP3155]|eukprot:CEM25392.1 unnamed protein product [Vitrella brassicaformis CCMP3155]